MRASPRHSMPKVAIEVVVSVADLVTRGGFLGLW